MKTLLKAIAVVAVIAVLSSVALAQGPWAQPGPGPQGGGPGMGPGGPQEDRCRRAPGLAGNRAPVARVAREQCLSARNPVATLRTCPESHQLWFRLGELQNRLQGEQWVLFELLNEEPKDPEKIRAQAEKMRNIQMEMREVQQQLQPYWVAPPRPQQGQGWQGGFRGRGPGVGGPAPGAGGPPPGAGGPPPPPPPPPAP